MQYLINLYCPETDKNYKLKTVPISYSYIQLNSGIISLVDDKPDEDTYVEKVLELFDMIVGDTRHYYFDNGYYIEVRITDKKGAGASKHYTGTISVKYPDGNTFGGFTNLGSSIDLYINPSRRTYRTFFFSDNYNDLPITPPTAIKPTTPEGHTGAGYIVVLGQTNTGIVDDLIWSTIVNDNGEWANGKLQSWDFISTAVSKAPSENPIYWNDTSNKKGGSGSYEYITDNIDFSELPSLSALTSGFNTLYQLPQSQIGNLAGFLWSNTFIDSLKKYFGSPNEAIINFGITKVPIVGTVPSRLFIGNVEVPSVNANRIVSEYVTMDFGSINIPEYWGNYLDYESTSVSIFLPYIGERNLDTKDIVDSSVSLKYYVDLFTGDCVAQIKLSKSYGLNSKLYSFDGNVFVKIPTSSSDMAQYYISSVGKIGGAVLAGSVSGGVGAVVALGATSALGMAKSNISHTGNVDGVKGLLNTQRPYLIITRPDQSLASDYNKLHGYPSNITMSLADCTGYTVVEEIHLENIPATSEEIYELDGLLKAGVIF